MNIISGKQEITIGEIGEIIETLQERAGQEAEIIWGNGYDETLDDKISVTILATGFVTNPNQTLQPKVEPEKFGLQTEPQDDNLSLKAEEEVFDDSFFANGIERKSEDESGFQIEFEEEEEIEMK